MKKMIGYTAFFIIGYFCIHSFTSANISIKNIFIEERKYPALEDDMQSDDLILQRITGRGLSAFEDSDYEYNPVNNEIIYFPEHNYFLIADRMLSTYFRIDSAGTVNLEYNASIEKESLIRTDMGFIMERDSVIDCSFNEPYKQPLEILNLEGSMDLEEWSQLFLEQYQRADRAIFNITGTPKEKIQVVIFNYENKWIKLYGPTEQQVVFYYSDPSVRLGNKIYSEKSGVTIPPVFLKDTQRNIYSNFNRNTDTDNIPFNSVKILNPAIEYPTDAKIKVKSFKKDYFTTEGYYNPGIPITYYGKGFFELKWRDKGIRFRTHTTKTILHKPDPKVYIFAAPQQYEQHINVRFLSYDYDVNYNDNGQKGIYVIKQKEKD